MGSEEFIRLQFEEYLLALLSCVNCQEHSPDGNEPALAGRRSSAQDVEGDPAAEFNSDFLVHWQSTSNYALFKRLTSDALLFSIVEPRHPCSGGLTIEDIQRRLAQQVAELHLDDRVREGRETLNKHLAIGQKKVSTAFTQLWADFEALRETQRKRNEEAKANQADSSAIDEKLPGSPLPISSPSSSTPRPSLSSVNTWFAKQKPSPIDFSQAQASVNAASQKAGAYFSSWGSWASDRRKEWQDRRSNTHPTSPATTTSDVAFNQSEGLRGSSPPTTRHSLSISRPIGYSHTGDQSPRGRTTSPRRRQSGETSTVIGGTKEGSETEEGKDLNRSNSRRKRWTGVFRGRDQGDRDSSSTDSPQFDGAPTRVDEAPSKSPRSLTSTPVSPTTAPNYGKENIAPNAGRESTEGGGKEKAKQPEDFVSVSLDPSNRVTDPLS